MTKTNRPLPTLAELHQNPQQAFKNDEFNRLMNEPPHESWIKKHPYVSTKNAEGKNVKLPYLPVGRVETLLTQIFQVWRFEVRQVQLILNSAVVTARVHFLHPVTGDWSYHDGVGASPIQTESGKGAGDFSGLKTAGVQMAVPAAASYALKDAAEHLGKLFGRDLSRKEENRFVAAYGQTPDVIEEEGDEEERPARGYLMKKKNLRNSNVLSKQKEEDFDL